MSGVNINVDEEKEVNVTLPTPSDKNPEDNPVAIKSAVSLDGKTSIIKDGYNLKIKALPGQVGSYKVEVEYGSSEGGLEKTVLQGEIKEDTRIEVNPFIRPQEGLNHYGSGDVVNDNVVDGQDLTRLNELIAGTYSNPSDKRLYDRADVNGDGAVNNQDKQILENKLNGSIPYLPGDWNKLQTRAEREDWLKKMLAIDEVSEVNGKNCLYYSDQLYINFHGFKNIEEIAGLLQDDPNYDVSKNGRFNLPVQEVATSDYNSEGTLIGGHAMNKITLGDDAVGWNAQCNIEPQTDQINVQIGEGALNGTNSKFYVRGAHGERVDYYLYTVKDKVPTLIWTNPDVKIITQRGK